MNRKLVILAAALVSMLSACRRQESSLTGGYGQRMVSGEVVMAVTAPEAENAGTTYTVVAGDSLSKIGAHHGVSWKAIFDANRDKLDDPDEIQPGQELTIPAA